MTKYVAEILRQLGINFKEYEISYHRDEESGDEWYSFHPNNAKRDKPSNLRDKLVALEEGVYGKYIVRWDENSCYLKVNSIIEISPNGKQLYPTPMVDKPALFSQQYIWDLWNNNREYISIPNTNEEVKTCKVSMEDFQRMKESIVCYDWREAIAYAKEHYPLADAVKFRVCYKTNTFNLRTDYNNFLCFDSEEEMKEAIVNYLTNMMKEWTIPDDYDLDIYVSTDAFISSDHEETEKVFDESDILDSNVYDDAEGNSWVSLSCVYWALGYSEPKFYNWNDLGLGKNPNILPKTEPGWVF